MGILDSTNINFCQNLLIADHQSNIDLTYVMQCKNTSLQSTVIAFAQLKIVNLGNIYNCKECQYTKKSSYLIWENIASYIYYWIK